MKYFQLRKELEIQHIIYEFLSQQYEQAKLEEARDTPTIQILDKAKPPYRKHSPKRLFIILAAGFSAIIVSSSYYFLSELKNEFRQRTNRRFKTLEGN